MDHVRCYSFPRKSSFTLKRILRQILLTIARIRARSDTAPFPLLPPSLSLSIIYICIAYNLNISIRIIPLSPSWIKLLLHFLSVNWINVEKNHLKEIDASYAYTYTRIVNGYNDSKGSGQRYPCRASMLSLAVTGCHTDHLCAALLLDRCANTHRIMRGEIRLIVRLTMRSEMCVRCVCAALPLAPLGHPFIPFHIPIKFLSSHLYSVSLIARL